MRDNTATSVSVTASSNSCNVGDNITITVHATDVEGNASVGKNVVQNGSTVGTTNSNGNYTTTVSFDSEGTKTLTYSVDGVTGSASVVVSKISTTTTLSTSSASVTVGSTITLSGSVSVNVANLSVGIYQGGTLVDTVYTDSSGNFSKTLVMSSVGSYSYTATFTGNSNYATSTSSSVSVTVSKAIPTISYTGSSPRTIVQGSTNYFSGVLSVNGSGIAGATVELYEIGGQEPFATTTTGNDGSYNLLIPSNTIYDDFYYRANYWGSDNYEMATSDWIKVIVTGSSPVPDNISLNSNKSILSYVDGETATLTATLVDSNDNPVEGYTVTFKKGDTTVGTDTTDSNGEAEYTYSSAGVGDVSITAECGSVDDTYTIEDCIYYDTSEHSSTGGNYLTIADLSSITLPSKFKLSFDYKTNYEGRCGLFSKNNFSGNPNYSVFVGTPSTSTINTWYYGYRTTSTSTSDVRADPTSYHNYSIERNGNTFKYLRDNSGNYSKSVTWFGSYSYVIGLMQWGDSTKSSSMKNIKLKAL